MTEAPIQEAISTQLPGHILFVTRGFQFPLIQREHPQTIPEGTIEVFIKGSPGGVDGREAVGYDLGERPNGTNQMNLDNSTRPGTEGLPSESGLSQVRIRPLRTNRSYGADY